MRIGTLWALVVLIMALGLLIGCRRDVDQPRKRSSSATLPTQVNSSQTPGENPQGDQGQTIESALAQMAKVRQERLQGGQTNDISLPNFVSGPGLPRPIGRNFYQIDKRYPDYLLCLYEVSEKQYDPSNESEWLKAALMQIRGLGQSQFPPIKWVAIIIANRAEHHGESTFEKSMKAGAIFNANEVFDMQFDLSKAVNRAAIDRNPFSYDPSAKPDQRWLLVERDAAKRTGRP